MKGQLIVLLIIVVLMLLANVCFSNGRSLLCAKHHKSVNLESILQGTRTMA